MLFLETSRMTFARGILDRRDGRGAPVRSTLTGVLEFAAGDRIGELGFFEQFLPPSTSELRDHAEHQPGLARAGRAEERQDDLGALPGRYSQGVAAVLGAGRTRSSARSRAAAVASWARRSGQRRRKMPNRPGRTSRWLLEQRGFERCKPGRSPAVAVRADHRDVLDPQQRRIGAAQHRPVARTTAPRHRRSAGASGHSPRAGHRPPCRRPSRRRPRPSGRVSRVSRPSRTSPDCSEPQVPEPPALAVRGRTADRHRRWQARRSTSVGGLSVTRP